MFFKKKPFFNLSPTKVEGVTKYSRYHKSLEDMHQNSANNQSLTIIEQMLLIDWEKKLIVFYDKQESFEQYKMLPI